MIDGAGLLRQITTEADIGSFMRHLTALDPAQIEAGFELSYTTTQTFDDYDQPVEIVLPEAIDITSELALPFAE